MLVIFVIIAIDKLVDQAIRLFRPAKGIFDGQPVEVLRDGVIHMSARGTRQIGNLELMELLRLKGVENLGSVRCAYMETSGALSVFAADPPQPGLRIVPPVECVPADCSPDQARCCVNCGQMDDAASHCPNCGTDGWAPAIAAPKYR
ncbi:YetF domain-containing protein [Gemmobacter lanyuensis]